MNDIVDFLFTVEGWGPQHEIPFQRQKTRQMSYLRLLKLLYIADRESLRDTGRPIIGDHALAMDQGPVLEGIYQLIKNTHFESPQWSRHFQVNGYRIKLAKDTGVGTLSRYELEKLREVAERNAAKSDRRLVEETHQFEEWKRNYQDAKTVSLETLYRLRDARLLLLPWHISRSGFPA